MRTSGMSKIVALSALVCALGVAPGKADAVVVTSGCAAADCTLSELLGGGSFLIKGTRFANWSLDPNGPPLDPSAIRITPLDQALNPGFRLTDVGLPPTLRSADGALTRSELSFSVTMESGPLRLEDSSLVVDFGDVSNPSGGDTFAQILENIFASGAGPLLAGMQALCTAGACANPGADAASFALQTSLLVFLNIDAVSADVGDVAQIVGATVNFSQIPEPATAALLALGMTGFGWSRRRRARG
jgi:hypothetical protein